MSARIRSPKEGIKLIKKINSTHDNLMYYGPLDANHVLVSNNVQTSTLTD